MEIQKIKLQMVKDVSAIYTAEKIITPVDIVELVNKYEQYNLSPTEKIILIGLDTKNQVNIYTEIATGGVNCTHLDTNNIFKPLLVSNCNRFILAHNHPSGDATPSKADIDLTNRIKIASDVMDIKFLDHIVIGGDDYTSIMSIMQKLDNEEVK